VDVLVDGDAAVEVVAAVVDAEEPCAGEVIANEKIDELLMRKGVVVVF
jgi:hypothetical protein